MKEAATKIIKEFEGLSLKAYPDPATGKEPWTIGYGETGSHVHRELEITQAQADAYLAKQIDELGKYVDSVIDQKLSSNETAALVSLIYNIGRTNFKISTLYKMLQQGKDKAEVAMEFVKWSKAGGNRMAGLVRRRAAETVLFLTR